MFRLSFALVAILFMAQGVIAQSSTPPSKAEVTARQVLGNFFSDFDAAASARDLDRFFEFYEHSPDLIFAFNGTIVRGFDAVKKGHADSWAQLESVRFKTTPESVVVLGANKVLVTAQGMSNRKYKDGRVIDRPYVITMLLVRRAGKWRVSQAHESVPSQ